MTVPTFDQDLPNPHDQERAVASVFDSLDQAQSIVPENDPYAAPRASLIVPENDPYAAPATSLDAINDSPLDHEDVASVIKPTKEVDQESPELNEDSQTDGELEDQHEEELDEDTVAPSDETGQPTEKVEEDDLEESKESEDDNEEVPEPTDKEDSSANDTDEPAEEEHIILRANPVKTRHRGRTVMLALGILGGAVAAAAGGIAATHKEDTTPVATATNPDAQNGNVAPSTTAIETTPQTKPADIEPIFGILPESMSLDSLDISAAEKASDARARRENPSLADFFDNELTSNNLEIGHGTQAVQVLTNSCLGFTREYVDARTGEATQLTHIIVNPVVSTPESNPSALAYTGMPEKGSYMNVAVMLNDTGDGPLFSAALGAEIENVHTYTQDGVDKHMDTQTALYTHQAMDQLTDLGNLKKYGIGWEKTGYLASSDRDSTRTDANSFVVVGGVVTIEGKLDSNQVSDLCQQLLTKTNTAHADR